MMGDLTKEQPPAIMGQLVNLLCDVREPSTVCGGDALRLIYLKTHAIPNLFAL